MELMNMRDLAALIEKNVGIDNLTDDQKIALQVLQATDLPTDVVGAMTAHDAMIVMARDAIDTEAWNNEKAVEVIKAMLDMTKVELSSPLLQKPAPKDIPDVAGDTQGSAETVDRGKEITHETEAA